MRSLLFPDLHTIQETVTVALGPLTLRFHALSLTHTLDTERELPSPLAVNGDQDDPAFRAQEMAINQLQSLRMIVESLEPGQIEFEARRETFPTAQGYYEALRDELTAFGFGLPHLMKILQALTRLNQISAADMEAATRDFLSEPPSRTPGPTSPPVTASGATTRRGRRNRNGSASTGLPTSP